MHVQIGKLKISEEELKGKTQREIGVLTLLAFGELFERLEKIEKWRDTIIEAGLPFLRWKAIAGWSLASALGGALLTVLFIR